MFIPQNTCQRFWNRELSWIEFNARVLSEGLKKENLPLDRLKFLAIVSSNFDEFFMVRVASVKRQFKRGDRVTCPSGMSPSEQLESIRKRTRELISMQYSCLNEEVLPELKKNGIQLLRPGSFSKDQHHFIREYFRNEIFPALSPVRVEKDGRIPQTRNLGLHIAFLLKLSEQNPFTSNQDAAGKNETALVILRIPMGLERIIYIPTEDRTVQFCLVEDIILMNAGELFPGYRIDRSLVYRITRDADLGVDEERDEDFMEAMEDVLIERRHSFPVRMETAEEESPIISLLRKGYGLEEAAVYPVDGPLDLSGFMDLTGIKGFDQLREPSWDHMIPPQIPEEEPLWDTLKSKDIVLHHPYESFEPVIRLLTDAAKDPGVMAIKMTLYRTSGSSPIIKALAQAAQNGKQVTVLVELKARFDEERNIGWAQHLERAGVIVIYGIARLKVHAKALLIVRREPSGIRRYVHLGTGNYNEKTARLYTDFSYLSAEDTLTYETALFFNAITGYSTVPSLAKLLIAPVALKDRLIQLIQREAERARELGTARIMAKLNSLADPEVIEALYEASSAGVTILLNVRGICMLKAGVKGLSENITVTSILDRYLEHSRMVFFENGGNEEVYLSSADWMPRNLERRVELMFPIEPQEHKARLIQALETFFRDTTNAQMMLPDGSYRRVKKPLLPAKRPGSDQRAQAVFMNLAKLRVKSSRIAPEEEFTVRRKPPRG